MAHFFLGKNAIFRRILTQQRMGKILFKKQKRTLDCQSPLLKRNARDLLRLIRFDAQKQFWLGQKGGGNRHGDFLYRRAIVGSLAQGNEGGPSPCEGSRVFEGIRHIRRGRSGATSEFELARGLIQRLADRIDGGGALRIQTKGVFGKVRQPIAVIVGCRQTNRRLEAVRPSLVIGCR